MLNSKIEKFLSAEHFAVAGASANRAKFGNMVLRALLQQKKQVVVIHPAAIEVEGTPTYKSLSEVGHPVESLSIITPPDVTERIVAEAVAKGIKSIWMQPGAESDVAIQMAESHGIEVIAGGPCLLVAVGFQH